ncbi:MAG: hypothetical protein ACYS74_21010 [Planctomycetota bacterium]|jgi:septal ring factor EnvC (AmiA/AmiB activator)
MRTMKRPLCIVAAVFCLAGLCQAQDSLDAKIAKLEAASRTRQASQQGVKTTVNAPVTLAEQLRGKVKTLAERLDELESRQKGMQEFSTGLDARLAELERNFEVSKAQSQEQAQKSHEALYAKKPGHTPLPRMLLQPRPALRHRPSPNCRRPLQRPLPAGRSSPPR